MISALFWGCFAIVLLALALADPQRDDTENILRQQCLSAAFETDFLIIVALGIEAILSVPYGFRIICSMLIAALIFACIMISRIDPKDVAMGSPLLDRVDAALEVQDYRNHCHEMCNDAFQQLTNNGFLFVVSTTVVLFVRELILLLFPMRGGAL